MGAWFSVTLVAVYVKYEPGANPACSTGAGGCSSAKVIGLLVFITFAMYWISEWLKNAVHVIISGVYGSWYFCSRNPPKGITRGAARRSLTYSFGSISLGSLVVAIINMLRQACSIARQQEANSGNFAADIALCVLQCLIGILDWAVQFINVSGNIIRAAIIRNFQRAHEFAEIRFQLYCAIRQRLHPRCQGYLDVSNTPFIRASTRLTRISPRLIKDRGIDALVNEVSYPNKDAIESCADGRQVFDRACLDHGSYSDRLPVCIFGLSVPDLHVTCIQQ